MLRCLRPDRIINGVKRFIVEAYGNNHFVQPPTLNYDKIYSQSNQKCPIVFVLSPGSDPLSDISKLAENMGFAGTKFKYLALGQGMETEAT